MEEKKIVIVKNALLLISDVNVTVDLFVSITLLDTHFNVYSNDPKNYTTTPFSNVNR